MAAGVPVIASRVGGLPEAVVDGVTGRLVTAGDVGALAAAIASLAADPTRARALGAAGALRVRERFTTAGMAAATLAVYRRLVDEQGGVEARHG
jgi:glycosyltransferase involved in cell wall biosynthesis